MIHVVSHICHEKRVAWVSISMHACDPVPIVMGPPELGYNIAHDWSYLSHHSMCLIQSIIICTTQVYITLCVQLHFSWKVPVQLYCEFLRHCQAF